tara:strand:- start:1268 stop:1756 length:489 start_codon:yes stop_codon:yes gene_type:complete
MREIFAHTFFIVLELVLLFVQYQRAEVFAFEVLPEFADVEFFFIYGSNLIGVLWLLLVVFFTYIFWEFLLKIIDDRKKDEAERNPNINYIKFSFLIILIFNVGVIFGEFMFFTKLIADDLASGTDSILALLVGIIMVGAHQVASFWIMQNVVHVFFFSKERK